MKKLLTALALAVSGSAYAAPISAAIAIPDEFILVNFAGSGLDWVYAGPVAAHEFGFNEVAPSSYRAGEGWRAATASEWAAHPLWNDFIAAGNPCGIASATTFADHSCYIYASEYWSSFSHVDAQDLAGRYGVRITPLEAQPWGITEFVVIDPSGVCWHIGQNTPGLEPVGRLP